MHALMLEHPERSFTTDRKGSRALIRRTVATVQHRSFTESACPPDTCRPGCRDDPSGFFGPRLVSPPRPKPILSGPDAGRPHRLFGNTFLGGSGSGAVGLSLWFFVVMVTALQGCGFGGCAARRINSVRC